MILALLAGALAGDVYEGDVVDLDVGGHVKAFTIATFPYESVFMAESPTGQGLADARLAVDLRLGSRWRLSAHHALTSFVPAPAASTTGGAFTSAGAGLTAPEAVDLTWELPGEDAPRDSLLLRGRTDRLLVAVQLPHLDLTLGRQPVTFGKALIFTPLDIVNPFSPAVIDQEYKPGVDAARADVYLGMTTQLTAVAAYAGDWSPEGMIYGLYGQGTLGVWDLGAFAGYVREDWVFGLATAGSAGPVGLRAEASVTLPAEGLAAEVPDEDPFVRAVVGADWRPGERWTLSGEAYVQTNGAASPEDYLAMYSSPRFVRGELWAAGRTYLALASSVEITPLLYGSVAVIGNLEDPSALIAPSLSWSISQSSELSFGGYLGAGKRPDELSLEELVLGGEEALAGAIHSEYGLLPMTAFLQLRAYF